MNKNTFLKLFCEFFKFDFYFKGLKKYAHLGGRTNRSDFFLFLLTVVCIYISLVKVCMHYSNIEIPIYYIIFMFPPVLSSMVRRLHDVGRSGYVIPFSMVLSALAFFSGIVFFNKDLTETKLYWVSVLSIFIALYPVYLFCLPSQKTTNEYDEMPSRPFKHGLMMLIFITIPIFFIVAIKQTVEQIKSGSMIDVLEKSADPLSEEEEEALQQLIQKQN